jgi:septal ring factor EnvC (AmiA/AmiB activator)
MSLFAKKHDSGAVDMALNTASAAATSRGYGIAEAIQLLRGLPAEQNGELVVRVVRATLASLDVRLPDIIEDATRKQKLTQDKIAAEHAQVAELEKQLETHRKEIATLEADLKETTTVKDRLQQAEKLAERNTSPLFVTGASAALSSTLLGRPLDKGDKLDKVDSSSGRD